MVYNDWAAEFQKHSPNRLILLPDLPSYDPLVAKNELLRCAKLGHKGAIVSDTVGRGAPIFEDAWAPFWDAAQETGMPIHVHLAGGLHSLKTKLSSWRQPAFVAVVPMQLDETLSGMIFSGTLEKRPRVKFVMGEAGLGWIPYVIERLDHELHKYGSKIADYKISSLPSEIFKRQVFTTYEDEKPRRRADPAHRRRQRDVGVRLPARRQHLAALAQGAGRVAARQARSRGAAQGHLRDRRARVRHPVLSRFVQDRGLDGQTGCGIQRLRYADDRELSGVARSGAAQSIARASATRHHVHAQARGVRLRATARSARRRSRRGPHRRPRAGDRVRTAPNTIRAAQMISIRRAPSLADRASERGPRRPPCELRNA